jgi:hypothetical protein
MIVKIFDAMRAGRELSNPAAWKNRQTTINLLVVLLSAAAYLINILSGKAIPDEVVKGAAEVIAIILGLVNAYLTTATSKKVGL